MSNPRKPDAEKVISGTFRPERKAPEGAELGLPEGAPIERAPPAPQYLNTDGQEFWRLLVQLLIRGGLIQEQDVFALEQAAYRWQQWRAKAKLGHPIPIAEERALMDILGEFGLTPSARRRVLANALKNPEASIAAEERVNAFAKHTRR